MPRNDLAGSFIGGIAAGQRDRALDMEYESDLAHYAIAQESQRRQREQWEAQQAEAERQRQYDAQTQRYLAGKMAQDVDPATGNPMSNGPRFQELSQQDPRLLMDMFNHQQGIERADAEDQKQWQRQTGLIDYKQRAEDSMEQKYKGRVRSFIDSAHGQGHNERVILENLKTKTLPNGRKYLDYAPDEWVAPQPGIGEGDIGALYPSLSPEEVGAAANYQGVYGQLPPNMGGVGREQRPAGIDPRQSKIHEIRIGQIEDVLSRIDKAIADPTIESGMTPEQLQGRRATVQRDLDAATQEYMDFLTGGQPQQATPPAPNFQSQPQGQASGIDEEIAAMIDAGMSDEEIEARLGAPR